ncbi:S-layer homology domain-containing protein [Paenibacillus baekrokdamisoli]|nr:S-layer homology domain-containing protein [Paenibacillus baekrokdamisoli]
MVVLFPYIPAPPTSSSTVYATPVIPADPSGVVMVEDFEKVSLDELYLDSIRNKGVTLALETNEKYVRNGAKSLRFDYDFIGVTDNPSQFAVGDKTQVVPLTGRVPKKIGMWVYGNNEGHGVTVKFRNAAGSTRNYDIRDEVTGIDWSGWKYVEATIGPDMSVPGSLWFYFQVKQRQMSKKNKGSLWIDDVRLIYDEPVGEDMTVPVVTPTSPTPNQTLNAPLSDITLSADDVGTGIDPNAIQLIVNGQSVTSASYAYDPTNKLITYHPEVPLDGGYYEVNATIRDKSGNPATADYSFNIEHGARLTMEAPEESLSSDIYRLQLGAKGVGAANSVHTKLKFDPATLQVKAITGRSDLSNVLTTIDNVGGYVKFSADGLQGDNVNPLASIDFEFTRTAKMERGETFKQIRMAEGAFGYTGGTSVNSFAAPINYKITFPYNLAIKGTGLQTQSIITVTNHAGAPVAGAAIEYLDPNGPQTYVTVTAANSNIYRNADGTTSLLAVKKDQQFIATTGSNSGFVNVYMPDGSRKGYISTADVQQNDLKLGIGLTDSKGEIHTPLLTLAKGTWILQAVKDGGSTESMSMEIVDQFGNDDPQYVQTFVAEDMRTMMNVGWQTAPRVQQTSIQYMKESEPTKSIMQDALTEVQVIHREKNGPLVEIKFHQASVTGLEPGTKYRYRVGYEGHWSTWYDYKTADPAQDKPTSFVFISDSHANSDNGIENYQKLMTDAFTNYPNTQFIMHGGDIVDDGNYLDEWTQIWKATSFYATSIPSGYAMGNHDVGGDGKEIFAKGWELPKNGPDFMKEYAYSFDSGEVHFIVMNSEGDVVTMAKQAEWLREDIQKSNKKWKMVMFHKPVYHTEKGRGDLIENTQTYFGPILEELGVDLVLEGHDHVYSHTYPMKKGKPLKNGERGTVYLAGGTSGWKFYDGTKYDYLDFMYDEHVPIYSAIQVSHDKISIQARTESGDLIDDYSIEKKDAPSVTPSPGVVTPGPTVLPDNLVSKTDWEAAVKAGKLTLNVEGKGGELRLPMNAADVLANGGLTFTIGGKTSLKLSPAQLREAAVGLGANDLLALNVIVEDAASSTEIVRRVQQKEQANLSAIGSAFRLELSSLQPDGKRQEKKSASMTLTLPVGAGNKLTGLYEILEDGSAVYVKGVKSAGKTEVKMAAGHTYMLLDYKKTYMDVVESHWAYDYITQLSARHSVQGVDNSNFAPTREVTRAEFAAMLVRELGLTASAASGFSDVGANAWYAEAVAAAKEAGLVTGTSSDKFNPNASISRQEMAAMIVRAYEHLHAGDVPMSGSASFSDMGDAKEWAKQAVAKAKELGLVNGNGSGQFQPFASGTRAESAKLVVQLSELL